MRQPHVPDFHMRHDCTDTNQLLQYLMCMHVALGSNKKNLICLEAGYYLRLNDNQKQRITDNSGGRLHTCTTNKRNVCVK